MRDAATLTTTNRVPSRRWHLLNCEILSSIVGIVVFAGWLIATALPSDDPAVTPAVKPDGTAAAVTQSVGVRLTKPVLGETVIGGYSGMSDTRDSTVAIVKPGQIDMTVRDFSWLGKPFEAPIYYGVRVQRWHGLSGFGSMVDFTHAKAIARASDDASYTGTRDGKALPAKAKISDQFRHLEFSHGHNLLTYNGLFRWPAFMGRVRPYVGGGAGITLPHTEVGFRDKNTRTYEYQFAGLVGQMLGGVEINVGRASVFFEYKFSYAPYHVPLSEEPRGFILFTDLWRQFRAWISGEAPSGGSLATVLATHHGVGGVLVRVGPSPVSIP
jgi:lipid A oxidase